MGDSEGCCTSGCEATIPFELALSLRERLTLGDNNEEFGSVSCGEEGIPCMEFHLRAPFCRSICKASSGLRKDIGSGLELLEGCNDDSKILYDAADWEKSLLKRLWGGCCSVCVTGSYWSEAVSFVWYIYSGPFPVLL